MVAVLGFHLRPSAVPGGFLGVDVFFVISGFLITTLLVRERRKNARIDLPAFWTRRARRLLPALVTVVATSIVVARIVEADLLVNIERQTLGAMTFSTNWIEIGASADYFDATTPLLFNTFWSLAVEEQFYVLWPVVVVGLAWARATPVLSARLAIGIAAASALLMTVRFNDGATATRVYYGTDTHLFGLMIGAALAFAFAAPVALLVSGRWQRIRLWIGYVGLAGVLALVFLLDSESAATYRGGILLASIASAAMVVALPGRPSGFTTMLGFRPLVWTGERSYGIYLWHWPLFLIISELTPAQAPGTPPSLVTVASVVAATALLSEASYRWIEGPIRRNGFAATWRSMVDRRLVPTIAPLVIALVVAAGVAVIAAPERSQAQLSVEAGLRAIAEQSPPVTGPQSTTPVTTNPGTTVPPSTVPPSTVPPSTVPPATVGVPTEPAWPPELVLPPGEFIIGLGDSVLSGAAPAMYERFPGIYLDATPILQWGDAPAMIREHEAAGNMRPVVVLHFGTNAGLKDESSVQALREALDEIGPERRVVLLTVVGISYWIPATNDTLRDVSADYPNTIVADWHAVIEESPELLHNDQTHPNMAGIAVYADLVASALEELGPG